ncbi:MAG TPA: 2-hydroxy-3-oxopropionate reductase [bacterium]
MANLGFVGLGIMGGPMAQNLVKGGHTLHVFDSQKAHLDTLVAKGAKPQSSCKAVAEVADVIFIIVPDTPDVDAVLFGAEGVAAGAKPGTIVVDMSSISPVETKRFAERLAKLGVDMLDAPVSGGAVGAESGTLSIMVGGKEPVLAKVRPYLELMGKTITHIGDHGAGQTCKVANQIIVALNLEAICEALLFASKAGADPEKVRKALMGGAANSRLLELKGEWILKRNFKPGFRVKHQQKDLNNALSAARQLGISLPNTSTTQELYNALLAEGGSDLDHCALVMALERLANYKVS